ELALRENFFYLVAEILPLHITPKIVRHQEAAVEQILPQDGNFFFVEIEATRLDHVNPRIAGEIGIRQAKEAAIGIDRERSHLLESEGEVEIAVGKIGDP